MSKKKLLLKPKSMLGFNKDLFICFNCMFWNPNTGRCPWHSKWNKDTNSEDTTYFEYNHYCEHRRKDFRYKLEYKHWINE